MEEAERNAAGMPSLFGRVSNLAVVAAAPVTVEEAALKVSSAAGSRRTSSAL